MIPCKIHITYQHHESGELVVQLLNKTEEEEEVGMKEEIKSSKAILF